MKVIYKVNADTIVGNCDSTLFLGGNEKTTVKELSETLGKESIDFITHLKQGAIRRVLDLTIKKLAKN